MTARFALVALSTLALAACNATPSQIRIIGSSTVYPFTSAVASAFTAAKKGPAPAISSTGTVAGFEAFCSGGGAEPADIADASRRITRDEFAKCKAKGIGEIMEIPIGLDGIALVQSNAGPKFAVSKKDLYLALAASPMGKPNAAKLWKDVNPALPAVPIRVFGPPPSSGTRGAFEQLLLQPGCLIAMPDAKAMLGASDPALLDRTCRQIRRDGAYVESGEDDDKIVAKLEKEPNALGIFGYSYLERNAARLHGVPVDGVSPNADTISSGKYPGERTLYLYVNAGHLKTTPGLSDFLALYATMWGPGGPLDKNGLIPMSDGARKKSADKIKNGTLLDDSVLD